VLQRVVVHCSMRHASHICAVCIESQSVVVRCDVLQCVVMRCSTSHASHMCRVYEDSHRVAVYCSALQCVVVCCSAVQYESCLTYVQYV